MRDYTYREILALVIYKRLLGRRCHVAFVCDRLGCAEWVARRALREAEVMLAALSEGRLDEPAQRRGEAGWGVACVLTRLVDGERLTVQDVVRLTGMSRRTVAILLDDLSRVTPLTCETVVVEGRARQEWYLI